MQLVSAEIFIRISEEWGCELDEWCCPSVALSCPTDAARASRGEEPNDSAPTAASCMHPVNPSLDAAARRDPFPSFGELATA